MPIIMYSVDQTGPNSWFGGLKLGLFNVMYQVLTDSIVNNPPIAPKVNGISKQMSKGKN